MTQRRFAIKKLHENYTLQNWNDWSRWTCRMRRKIGLNGFGAQILHKLLSFGQIHDTRDTLGWIGHFYFILLISLFEKKTCTVLIHKEEICVTRLRKISSQAAQTHVAREGCNVIYITYVTRRCRVTDDRWKCNRLCMGNILLRFATAK